MLFHSIWSLPLPLLLILINHNQPLANAKQLRKSNALSWPSSLESNSTKTIEPNSGKTRKHEDVDGGQTSNLPVKQLRKQLRGKQRRLRKLVDEINNLKNQISQPTTSEEGEINNSKKPRRLSKKRTKMSWRRRVMGELRRLNEQIGALTSETNTNSKSYNFTDVHHHRRPASSDLGPDAGSSSNEDQAKLRVKLRRMRNKRKRLKKIKQIWSIKPVAPALVGPAGSSGAKAIIVDANKGAPGSQCRAHRDCKPGSCCHTISATNSSSVCFEHHLDAESSCANSCQCIHGLNCFRSRKDKMHHKKTPFFDTTSTSFVDDQRNDVGRCKVAAADDILHGEYVNQDNSTFSSLEFKV